MRHQCCVIKINRHVSSKPGEFQADNPTWYISLLYLYNYPRSLRSNFYNYHSLLILNHSLFYPLISSTSLSPSRRLAASEQHVGTDAGITGTYGQPRKRRLEQIASRALATRLAHADGSGHPCEHPRLAEPWYSCRLCASAVVASPSVVRLVSPFVISLSVTPRKSGCYIVLPLSFIMGHWIWLARGWGTPDPAA